MKKVACLVVMLAMVASASATVRVFVTSSASGFGLADNANAFTPTVSTVYSNDTVENGFDYWADYDGTIPGPIRPGTYPAIDAPSGSVASPIQIDVSAGDFGYVWLQFQSEPNGAKINGLIVTITENGGPVYDPNNPSTWPAGISTTYYLCNNLNNLTFDRRWNGTAAPPGYPEWNKINGEQQTMVAVTAQGIQNKAAVLEWNLWSGGASRIALLGAFTGPAESKIYDIVLTQCNYATPPNPTVAGGVFQLVPEPASLALLGLVSLLLRRR